MFVIATVSAAPKFYTGRAGSQGEWLSAVKAEAFKYASRDEATRRANSFNGMTPIHGLSFEVREA